MVAERCVVIFVVIGAILVLWQCLQRWGLAVAPLTRIHDAARRRRWWRLPVVVTVVETTKARRCAALSSMRRCHSALACSHSALYQANDGGTLSLRD
jgi:hypothetical protein